MEILESASSKETAGAEQEGRVSIDRFVATRRFEVRDEEEKVEAAMALYEKAARARFPSEPLDIPLEPADEEELEAMSQQLKLQQKCQDIAALILVDEQEEELEDDEDDEPKKRRRK